MDCLKVFLFGKEQPYFQDLRFRFQKEFPNRKFEFKQFFPEDEEHFQSALIELSNFDPGILFIDYSSRPKDTLSFARSVRRCFPRLKAVVGLWDISVDKNLLNESNTTGVYINHIKSPELSEVIFQALSLASDSPLDKKTYATANFQSGYKITLCHLMKIGFLTENYMHIEHGVKLPPMGTSFNLTSTWNDLFEIDNYELLRRIDQNYYYHYPYSSDIKYNFQVETEEPPPYLKTEEDIQKWKDSQKPKIEAKKKELSQKANNWIIQNIVNNQPKRTRLLIIDPTLAVFKQADKPLDEYPYSIRFYSELLLNTDQISRVKPGIIAIQLMYKKDQEEMQKLFEELSRYKEINPFIIVFNTELSTDQARKIFKDDHIMTHQGEFCFDTVLKLCDSYQRSSGRERSHDQATSYAKSENRFYPSKFSEQSAAYLNFDVSILKLNEAFISFESPFELEQYSTYEVKSTVSFRITIMGAEIGYAENCYWAVIHGVSETDRKNLRQFINKSIKSQQS